MAFVVLLCIRVSSLELPFQLAAGPLVSDIECLWVFDIWRRQQTVRCAEICEDSFVRLEPDSALFPCTIRQMSSETRVLVSSAYLRLSLSLPSSLRVELLVFLGHTRPPHCRPFSLGQVLLGVSLCFSCTIRQIPCE